MWEQKKIPVEVRDEGADISGRVLLRVLPLALSDSVYVIPETLRPCTHWEGHEKHNVEHQETAHVQQQQNSLVQGPETSMHCPL